MILSEIKDENFISSVPRMRGDDPVIASRFATIIPCSPHARG